LKYGSIAADLANYFLLSEQTSAAFRLSVTFDPRGNVTGAGGLFLHTLPNTNAGNKRMDELEHLVHSLPSLGEAFSANQHPEDFITGHFSSFSPELLSNRRVEFFCQCKKETISRIITGLPIETLEDMLTKGPFPVEILCHNCNTTYQFDKSEIEVFYLQKEK
jgi:molecular chaperone Hsp33